MPRKSNAKRATKSVPRTTPTLNRLEIEFCMGVITGNGDPRATNEERITAAGARVGLDAKESVLMYNRRPIQTWIKEYTQEFLTQMARRESADLLKRNFSKSEVLTILYDLAKIPPEKTRGSISGQVDAVSQMAEILGLKFLPKDPDEHFKGRSIEEMEFFATHGCFPEEKKTPPQVM